MSDTLARRRTLPTGGQVFLQPMRDGWPVRVAIWPGRADGPGSLLFITGRGDFLEKYCETFHDLVDAGWGVMSFDWRGQGLSGRQGDDTMKGHSPGFANWLDDLDALVALFQLRLPRPWHAAAHSMGGHLLQRHLAGENGEFTRAVLLSPMLGLVAKPLGSCMTRLLARIAVTLGKGGAYVPGGGPYVAGTPGSYRQRLLTSDAERYGDEGWWVAQNPALAIGSVTYGWLDAAFRSLDALFAPPPGTRGSGEGAGATPMLGRINTPLLILIPDHDGLVDNRATQRALAQMPLASLEEFPGAGHELLRETPAIRSRVLARLTAFLQDTA